MDSLCRIPRTTQLSIISWCDFDAASMLKHKEFVLFVHHYAGEPFEEKHLRGWNKVSFSISDRPSSTTAPYVLAQILRSQWHALNQKFETYFPRNETAQPCSKCLHLFIWKQFIFSRDRSYLESLFSCIAWENSRLNCKSGEKGRELLPISG
jgi:hypothetical protein